MTMDEASRLNIAELEKLGGPTGIGKIDRGECPIGAVNPMGCMLCPYGHMLECHHPYTCEEAQCSHYRREIETEDYGPDDDIY
jgi:hypothetical protein